jgi:hypothetical protein
MKPLTIILAMCIFIFGSCSKNEIIAQSTCDRATLLSDKYSSDSVFLKTDTLWFDAHLCGKDLQNIKAAKDYWIIFCSPPIQSMPSFTIEHCRYVIGNKITYPLRLK